MSSDLRAFHQTLADRVLDVSLAPDKALYVPDIHLQDDGTDLMRLLADQIGLDDDGAYLFTGQRGTGKSTELLRLKKLLEQDACEVFYIDMADFLNLTAKVDIQDFLISVVGGFSEQIAARFSTKDPTHRTYFTRIWHFLQSDVKLEGIETQLPLGPAGDASLKFALRDDPDFKKRLQEKTRGYLSRIVADARAYVKEAIELVHRHSDKKAPRIVLIVDSVERIRGTGMTAEDVFCSVQELFSGQSDNLRFPGLHIVYTIPPYLLALSAALGAYYNGGAVFALSSVHLFEHRSRTISPRGLQQMIVIVARRFPAWANFISEELLRRLAEKSGGDIRDYFRMLQLCLAKAMQKPAAAPKGVVTEPLVKAAEAMLERDMLPIAENDLIWLKRIAQSHDACLPDNKQLATLARFFEGKLVLNYRNGEDWYDVHPLIRDHVGLPAATP